MSNSKRFPTIGQTVPTLKAILPEPPMGKARHWKIALSAAFLQAPRRLRPAFLAGGRCTFRGRRRQFVAVPTRVPALPRQICFFYYPVFSIFISFIFRQLSTVTRLLAICIPQRSRTKARQPLTLRHGVLAPLGPLELGPTRLQRIRNPSDSSPVSSRKPSLSNSDNYSAI